MWGTAAMLLLLQPCPEVEVPFELDEDRGGIVVPLAANGHRGSALLDTGAGHTVVSTDLLGTAAGLPPGEFSPERPGLVATRMWIAVELRVAGVSVGRHRVQLMDMSEVSRVYRRRVDGLLGQDVLTRFGRVVIDFEARRIHLARRAEERCSSPRE